MTTVTYKGVQYDVSILGERREGTSSWRVFFEHNTVEGSGTSSRTFGIADFVAAWNAIPSEDRFGMSASALVDLLELVDFTLLKAAIEETP